MSGKQNETDSEQATPFRWSGKRLEAARLLAEDRLTDVKIAEQLGVKRTQLWRWRQHPAFAARIKHLLTEMGDKSLRYAIAQRSRRIGKLDRMFRRLERIIKERAADPRMVDVPGGRTGLIVIEEAEVAPAQEIPAQEIGGTTVPAHVIPPIAVPTKVAVDTGLLKEYRELLKQAAQETGQWLERRQLSGPDGGAIPIQIIEFIRPALQQSEPDAPAVIEITR